VPDGLRDALSGLLNDDYFRAALPNRVATARRVLRPISLGVVGLSDESMTAVVAYALQDTLRESDTACRLDDGRFAVLLEDTPEEGAVWTLERLRRLLDEQRIEVTIWGGIASYPAHALDAGTLLEQAEAALAAARDWPAGRIEVALAP
jgi:diguanylate cyclase (GGDEF)-like protein